ncbi:MAG: alpha/beta hydrolase, partial [Brachymonas sp.]|nr:alpha/beta hydrolase [Brachymonas sp.]
VHGMAEHGARYARLAGALTGEGFVVYAHDHRGHGQSATPGSVGHMGQDGWLHAHDDLRALIVKEQAAHPGLPYVLFGHSMGGLAIRAWAARHERRSETMRRVHHIFTLGTPHQGTSLATMSVSTNGLQMRQNSTWLANNAAQLPANFAERCTCFYSNCDNIVFPASTACLQGADNQLIEGVGHVELAFIPGVRQTCWRALA